MGSAKLEELDKFYVETLPKAIKERGSDPHLTKDELVKLMDWKLTRGKWRPRLLKFVSELSDEEVKDASRKAFKDMPDLKGALRQLDVLKGVGPATASAILAAYAPDVAPFMSDEASAAVLATTEYTVKSYLEFADRLTKKAAELNALDTRANLTPSDLERALWASQSTQKTKAKKTPKKPSSQPREGKATGGRAKVKPDVGKKRQKSSSEKPARKRRK